MTRERLEDVIAAVATPTTVPAAIGVVRLSGPGAHRIARDLCPDIRSPKVRHAHLAWIRDPRTGHRLDQVIVVLYGAGASYTGEESAELFCHGGPLLVQKVLEAALHCGARQALPGEFTRRAVANGRMDLVQAEAVALLCDARTDQAIELGAQALQGLPSRAIHDLKERLLDILAEVEASLDFDEEDGVVVDIETLVKELDEALERVQGWLDVARRARPALGGVRIGLFGPPNAGKSSIFNAILGERRALVHPEPGTTRDVVSETLTLEGIPCVLVDTAGWRDADQEVERLGVQKTREEAKRTDVRVLVLDPSTTLPPSDIAQRWLPLLGRCDVVVLAKRDLWPDRPVPRIVPEDQGIPVVVTSTVTRHGLEDLRAEMARVARLRLMEGRPAQCLIVGARQVEAATTASHALEQAILSIRSREPFEVAAIWIRRATEAFLEILGERVTEEVLDRIFEKFCIGK